VVLYLERERERDRPVIDREDGTAAAAAADIPV